MILSVHCQNKHVPAAARHRAPHHQQQQQQLLSTQLRSLHHHRSSRRTVRAVKASGSMFDAVTAKLDALVQDSIVWASQHGLVVGLGGSTAPPSALIHAPHSLLPVAFPKQRFTEAKAAMTQFNELIDRVARDEHYLRTTLTNAAQHDDFTRRLLDLMETSAPARAAAAGTAAAAPAGSGGVSEVVLGIHRSDYMLDAPSGRFLQVELNTIASSFGCLSTLTTQLHAHNLSRLTAAATAATAATPQPPPQQQQQQLLQLLTQQPLVSNAAMAGISRALAAAVRARGGESAVLVMVVQPGERNAYDQQWLQQTLWEQHKVVTHRLSLGEIPDALELQPVGQQQQQQQQQQRLVLRSTGQEVGCVYFRAGYTPNDYPTEREWQARALIEVSTTCKCPSVTYQLAGSKKVQQDLARHGVVETFVGEQQGQQLRQLFAGLWSLDDPAEPQTAAIIQDAIQNPGRYVLKPQREGGGNNLYGEELVQELQQGLETDGGKGLAAYILMQRIVPPPQRTVFVRGGEWMEDESLSELGIYGVYLKAGDEVLCNEEVGHLVRTKTSSSNEGGVAAGYAVLDSPLLVDPTSGLLHPSLEGTAAAAAGGEEVEGSRDSSWGAAGGVLAAAKALLQS